MCKVSDKLKLCSCHTDINKLKHFWIFHRFDNRKNDLLVGETMLPAFIDPENDTYNRRLLPELLNEGNVFDVELNPKDKDLLQLSFTVKFPLNIVTYGFKFRKGKWIATEFGGIVWSWHHCEEKSGKIIKALRKEKQ